MRWKQTEYSGWGRVLQATGRLARPERASQLAEVTPLPAIGNLKSYGDAALVNDADAIDMTRMDRFLSFDETTGILEAEAGVTISEILRVFAPKGWMPAVMPGTGFATLGGCIANDVHGKNHQKVGSFGQHVESIVLIGADGKSRRVSPKREGKVFAATMGGLGQTGIIVSAKIKMIPCAGGQMSVSDTRIDDLDAFIDAFELSTASYSVGWIDAKAQGQNIGRGILEEAEFIDGTKFDASGKTASMPFNAPSFAMSSLVVKAFNALYLRRVPVQGRTRLASLLKFYFPLDSINNWNRLYGKNGFHQFQCVIPMEGAPEVLADMLGRIGKSGLASPLAVLKRMGDGRAGPMSFPMEGMTLAVDFPNKELARYLLAELEAITLAAGGRIYLAKDSLASGEHIKAMYPEHADFAAVANRVDPEHLFETDLVKRLDLRGQA